MDDNLIRRGDLGLFFLLWENPYVNKSFCVLQVSTRSPSSLFYPRRNAFASTKQTWPILHTNLNFCLGLQYSIEEAFRHKKCPLSPRLKVSSNYCTFLTFSSKSSILLRLEKGHARAKAKRKANFLALATWPKLPFVLLCFSNFSFVSKS